MKRAKKGVKEFIGKRKNNSEPQVVISSSFIHATQGLIYSCLIYAAAVVYVC